MLLETYITFFILIFSIIFQIIYRNFLYKNLEDRFLLLFIFILIYFIIYISLSFQNIIIGYFSFTLYLLLLSLYFHLYAGMTSSLSLRILNEISLMENKSLNFEKIIHLYNEEEIFEKRIKYLKIKNIIIDKNNIITINKRYKLLIILIILLKKIYRIPSI